MDKKVVLSIVGGVTAIFAVGVAVGKKLAKNDCHCEDCVWYNNGEEDPSDAWGNEPDLPSGNSWWGDIGGDEPEFAKFEDFDGEAFPEYEANLKEKKCHCQESEETEE